MLIEEIIAAKQYSLNHSEKEDHVIPVIRELIRYHSTNCSEFGMIWESLKQDISSINHFEDIPFLPVRIFKELEMLSVEKTEVFKTLFSSGTTSQKVSKIFLDKSTALLQTKALGSIISSYIGAKRLPMLIVDTESVLKKREEFTARGAGILGLSNFGRDRLYVLDENYKIRFNELEQFIEKYDDEPILVFGFTFMIWQYLLNELSKNRLNNLFRKGILIHSGGWKKLVELNITNEVFKTTVSELLGIKNVYNFYGMVEQVGGVYMECEEGFFHSTNFTEIVIRSSQDFSVLIPGNSGLIQTISILPKSYPGFSILTEDLGVINGIDDCKCGRKGTYFTIIGRLPKTELRGCSDTHAYL